MKQQIRPSSRLIQRLLPSGDEPEPWGDHEKVWLRSVLGRFTTGVTVITAAGPEEPIGMTANAFSSVSLDPPLVLVCLNAQSRSGSDIRDAGHFAVNILAEAQQPLAKVFARWDPHRFRDIDTFTSYTGAPILAGALGYLDCTLHEQLTGGTHSVLIGRVVAAGIAESHASPLVFFDGGYRRLHPD
ncbi:flavin reductase family protein [Actinoplanes auranticolor]|uniref:Oxidoreductase n=1 Tax=Actinoplanes auranticolor TaxID=47988 RepID=A0A919S6U6_9ACTN|nr:flavin reductase family protein [Actinoplanes auranticolor]GIM66487.1 oxidoreductase [Actinoplanes auranticolor]